MAGKVDAVVLLSGGLDSAVLTGLLLHQGYRVGALSVHYGQRHACEVEAARNVAAWYQVPHTVLDLPQLAAVMGGSALTDPAVPVPEGHYEAETMKATVVPNRNMVLLALAGAHAIAQGASFVAYGAHAGDHAVYPDCRRPFFHAMSVAFTFAASPAIFLRAPFVDMTKAAIVKEGARLQGVHAVPFKLTWSCYKGSTRPGGPGHCGKCGTCVERQEAFTLAGVPDPTTYLG